MNDSREDTPIFNPFPASLSHELKKKKMKKNSHRAFTRSLHAEVEHLHDAGVVKLTDLRKGVNPFAQMPLFANSHPFSVPYFEPL